MADVKIHCLESVAQDAGDATTFVEPYDPDGEEARLVLLRQSILAEVEEKLALLTAAQSVDIHGRPTVQSKGAKAPAMGRITRMETGDDSELSFRPLYEKADDSYFYRVQAMLLYEDFTAWLALHVAVVVAMIMLQIVALQSVWHSNWFPSDFERRGADEAATADHFPGGVPRPVSYGAFLRHYDDTKAFGIPLVTFLPLVFCCVVVIYGTEGEIDECKAGYVLLRHELDRLLEGRTRHASAANAAARLAVCALIAVLRASLVWYFHDILAIIFGTSNGPFSLLLNSLALVFIFELDNVVHFDMPNKNFYGLEYAAFKRRYARRLRASRAAFRDAVSAVEAGPAYLRHVYLVMGWASPVLLGSLVFTISLRLQGFTSFGRLVTVDDDSAYGAHHEALTRLYGWCVYALGFVIVQDHECAIYVLSGGKPRALAAALAFGAAFGAVLVFARHVLIRWALGCLLPYGLSGESWPLDVWARLDPAPNRPEDLYDYYDYYDYADEYDDPSS